MELREEIRIALAQLPLRLLTCGYQREAAVLMLIFEREGTSYFLLTRRTQDVSTHKGQISFPGGMRHSGESLHETALRETYEEVGIEENRIEILGRFHDYVSITGHLVVPFVGYIAGDFVTVPQIAEVAEVLQVPFEVFADPGRLRIERTLRAGQLRDMYFYHYEPHEIWGLTALIIKDFLADIRWKPC